MKWDIVWKLVLTHLATILPPKQVRFPQPLVESQVRFFHLTTNVDELVAQIEASGKKIFFF